MGSKWVALWYYLIVILATVISKNGVPIRLTEERWNHTILTHQEIEPNDFNKFMKVISNPELILKGSKGELLAIQKVSRKKIWIVVPYKETLPLRGKEVTKKDGFVLTCYFTSDLTWLLKKEIVWSK